MIMNGSMTDERVVTSSSASSRLVAVMVRPLPVAHDLSELEAVMLHLAAHFALRKEMRRAGSAVLSLFDEGDSLIVRYDMPVHASWQQAQRWTTEFWDDLAYVDLAKPNFLFMFVGPGEATTVSAGQ